MVPTLYSNKEIISNFSKPRNPGNSYYVLDVRTI
jgi:hypothetical protein